MKKLSIILLLHILISGNAMAQRIITGKTNPMPLTWEDRDTAHQVFKLNGPTGGLRNWYFHNNPFFPGKDGSGDLMVFDGWEDQNQQIFTINLNTRAISRVTSSEGKKRLIPSLLQMTREILYQTNDVIYAVNVDTKKVRKVYEFSGKERGNVTAINADGTLLAGIIAPPEEMQRIKTAKKKQDFFYSIYNEHPKNEIFLINLKNQSFQIVHSENNWLNHVQFSPVDAGLLMFCREGPWEKVDRIWTLRIDTNTLKLIHNREVENEIAGHEFFSQDGRSVWYDLQIPRKVNFFIASASPYTGAAVNRYSLGNRLEWSYHYAISPDQTWFAGDGNEHSLKRQTGKWIYAYYPEGNKLRVERLVGLKRHDYSLEPNVHISPDGKWVVFGANFEGSQQTYAVEVAKKIN